MRSRATGQMVIKSIVAPKLFDETLGGMRATMAKTPMTTPIATATPKTINFVCWRWTGVDTRL